MTTETQGDTNLYCYDTLKDIPLRLFLGEIDRAFGPADFESQAQISPTPGVIHEVRKKWSLSIIYPSVKARHKPDYADFVIIVMKGEESRDKFLRALSRMAKKRQQKREEEVNRNYRKKE